MQQSPSDLGYYEDGTRRTLTDEQIAMFRHSEIQRLLAARRQKRDAEEEKKTYREQKERKPIHKERAVSKVSTSTLYDDDSTVHARIDTDGLNYDDADKQPGKEKPTTFQWPLLGS